MFTTDLVNRNILKTSLYIYIFQDKKCRLYAQSIFIYVAIPYTSEISSDIQLSIPYTSLIFSL